MLLIDGFYWAAYGLFLVGASLQLRGICLKMALWLMVSGVVIDFFATVMPSSGVKSLAVGIGSSPSIVAAMSLGVLVWCLFLAAVFVRLVEKQRLFGTLIIIIEIAWFVDLVLFLQGVYGR